MSEHRIMTLDSDIVRSERPAKRLRLRAQSADTGANPLSFLSWQPKRADAVWTQSEWTALCEHLHNGNDAQHFVMGFRDKDGCKKYVRSKKWRVDRAISWSWQSIAGAPKSRLAFVPYSVNAQQQSRWGGMDFDAHQPGQADRARELALAAFRILLNTPGLAVILETSGSGGWHVWAISLDFIPAGDWIRLLKSVAEIIGTVILSGVCEIFPPDSQPSRYGKGMRAPGSWNPSTDKFNEIVCENCRTSLEPVLSRKSKVALLKCKGLANHFPDTEKKDSFSAPSISNPINLELLHKFRIKDSNTRNDQLAALTGDAFHQFGVTVARQTAQAQFQRKSVSTEASEQEHMASFENLWAGLVEFGNQVFQQPSGIYSTGWKPKTSVMPFGSCGALRGKRSKTEIFRLRGITWRNGWASPAKARRGFGTSSPSWASSQKPPTMCQISSLRGSDGCRMVGRPIISEKGFYRAGIIRQGLFAHTIPAQYALLLAFPIIPLQKIKRVRNIC
jgi:hypothetical protein